MAQLLTLSLGLLCIGASASPDFGQLTQAEDNNKNYDITKLVEQQREMQAEIQWLRSKLETLEKKHASGSVETFENPVAFTVALSQLFQAPVEDVVIPFDVELLNIGNGYSMATNYFTAPVTGLYWFTASIHTSAGRLILVVNDETVASAASQEAGDSGAAMSIMVTLNAGESVTCVKDQALDFFYGMQDGHYRNVFSGFLYTEL